MQHQQQQPLSLFIPTVFSPTSDAEMTAAFTAYGVVERVDRVRQMAYVHLVSWHASHEAQDMRQRLLAGGSVRVFYDGDKYWKVFASKEKKAKAKANAKANAKVIVLEELPAWEDPTPHAPIPRFDRKRPPMGKQRDILDVDLEHILAPIGLERQESKHLACEVDALLQGTTVVKPRSLSDNKRSPPLPAIGFDFDALVADPNYGAATNTPKSELRALMSRSETV